MTVILPSVPDSLTPFSTPMIEPSLAPKKPFRFGWAWMIVLARSVDLRWSPAPYCVSTIVMFGCLVVISSVKPLTPVDAGAAGLVVGDDRDLALVADQLRHLLGSLGGGGDVVGRRGRHRDVAVDTGVEADHRDVLGLGPFQQGIGRLAVESRQADRGRLLVERGLEHLDLLVDLRLGLRALERDVDIEFRRPPSRRRA